MAKKETGTFFSQAAVLSITARSGDTYISRYSPAMALRLISLRSASTTALFRNTAGMPICRSCATWSCISAISGDITTAVLFSSSTAGNW